MARVGNRYFELASICRSRNPNGFIFRTMGYRVGHKVRDHLRDAFRVTRDGLGDVEFRFDDSVDVVIGQLSNYVFQDGLDSHLNRLLYCNPPTQPSPRKIHDVIDQLAHPNNASLHHAFEFCRVLVSFGTSQESRTSR